MKYKGIEIDRIKHNGFYSAFIMDYGFLKADTLNGIKKLIAEAIV